MLLPDGITRRPRTDSQCNVENDRETLITDDENIILIISNKCYKEYVHRTDMLNIHVSQKKVLNENLYDNFGKCAPILVTPTMLHSEMLF